MGMPEIAWREGASPDSTAAEPTGQENLEAGEARVGRRRTVVLACAIIAALAGVSIFLGLSYRGSTRDLATTRTQLVDAKTRLTDTTTRLQQTTDSLTGARQSLSAVQSERDDLQACVTAVIALGEAEALGKAPTSAQLSAFARSCAPFLSDSFLESASAAA